MDGKQELYLTEKFVLMGIYATEHGLEYTYEMTKDDCCIGSTLLELLYDGFIQLDDEGKIEIVDEKMEIDRDDYTKKMLEKLSAIEKKMGLKRCAKFFIDEKDDGVPKKHKPLIKTIYDDVASCLVKKEIVEEKKKSFLLIDITNYKLKDKEAVDPILLRIHRELFNKKPPSMEVISLFVLLKKANLLDEYFSKYEQRKFKDGLKKWAEESETFRTWIAWTMAVLNEKRSDDDDFDFEMLMGSDYSEEDFEELIEEVLSFFD